jgi:hypothetical protein
MDISPGLSAEILFGAAIGVGDGDGVGDGIGNGVGVAFGDQNGDEIGIGDTAIVRKAYVAVL